MSEPSEAAKAAAREIAHDVFFVWANVSLTTVTAVAALLDDPSIANEVALANWGLCLRRKLSPRPKDSLRTRLSGSGRSVEC